MLNSIIRYSGVGILNTLIHWTFFALAYLVLSIPSQAFCNFIAFSTAAAFSYYANSKFTFQTSMQVKKFFLFYVFMALLSILFGLTADHLQLSGLIMLVLFSGTSFLIGFCYSNFYIFKKKEA